MNDSLENELRQPVQLPQSYKNAAAMASIGNAMWALGFVALLLYERFGPSTGRGEYSSVLKIMLLVGLLVSAMAFMGARQLLNGKRSGYYPYLISNSIWVGCLFANPLNNSYDLWLGGISLVFIAYLMTIKKYLS